MAVQINWGLARTPDFSQNALQGYQQGQAAGKQMATQNALRQYATNPDSAITALTSVDPVAGSQLRQARTQDLSMQRQEAFRQALTQGDMAGATRAAAGDPALMQSLSAVQSRMKTLNDAQAAGLQAVKGIADPNERARVWDTTVAPGLVQLGMDPNAVSSKSGKIDFTDAGIAAAVGKTLTAKDQIDLGFKQGDLKVKQDTQAETGRHNAVDEAAKAAQLAEDARHHGVDEKNAGITANAAASRAGTAAKQLQFLQSGGGMTPDDIEFWAQRNATDGTMPSLMGPTGTAIKKSILSRSAEIQRGQGGTGTDMAANVAGAKANSAALSDQAKKSAVISAAEQTANATGDLALQLAQQGGAGPSAKIFNRPIQKIRSELSDPHAAAFNNAIGTFRDEYAKVVGGGQVTDKLRNDIDSRINSAMSVGELQKVISTMKQEMQYRTQSQNAGQATLKGNIKTGNLGASGAPAAASAPVRVNSPAEAAKLAPGTQFLTPDGQVRVRH